MRRGKTPKLEKPFQFNQRVLLLLVLPLPVLLPPIQTLSPFSSAQMRDTFVDPFARLAAPPFFNWASRDRKVRRAAR